MGHVVASPNLLWPKGVIPFKFDEDIDGFKAEFDISAPVGAVAAGEGNKTDDVRKVQNLLNKFAPADGGPSPKLMPSGTMNAQTLAAIRHFQQAHFGWQDGRVDPGHATLIELTTGEDDLKSDDIKAHMINAVHQWNRRVGKVVHWVRHTPGRVKQPNFVVFKEIRGRPSFSPVGVLNQGLQVVGINVFGARAVIREAGDGGTLEGLIMHEMGHTAGLHHEHQRRDRDDFVQIDETTADPGRLKRDLSKDDLDPPGMPSGCYDFGSIMHYHGKQASREDHAGQFTIRKRSRPGGPPLPDNQQPILGSRRALSDLDVATLTKLYSQR
jgi:Astacin (Peptidase family M12A)/Putative peptidoglycan binding domain